MMLVSTTTGAVVRWFPLFVRAVKACRLYPAGSTARERHLEAAFTALTEALDAQHEIQIDVKGSLQLSILDGIAREELDALSSSLAADEPSRDRADLPHVRYRYLDLADEPSEPSPELEVLIRLFDSMVGSRDYEEATKLVLRLQDFANRSKNPDEAAFAQHLLGRFSRAYEIEKAIEALNSADRTNEVMKIGAYLRALDHHAARALLMLVDRVAEPHAREMVAEILIEATAMDRASLVYALPGLRWEVACHLVVRSRVIHVEDRLDLLLRALEHPHPKTRVDALRELKTCPKGRAEETIARAIHDRDSAVRLVALKVAGARRTLEALRELSRVLLSRDLAERDPRELRQIMVSYAAVAGERALFDLGRFLLHSGSLFRWRRTRALRTAAAHGLRALRSDAAVALLEKGARSLRPGVRNACKATLDLPPIEKPPRGAEPEASAPPVTRTIGRGIQLLGPC